MKKFLVSDLHGNGEIYDAIISFLENYNAVEDVTLYINGDLIDRGIDSGRMLVDIYDRITNNKGFKIEYLAGNHEWLMYQASLEMKNNVWPIASNIWFDGNGGENTAFYLEDYLSLEKELAVIKFVSNLKIYHKFHEKLDGKNIVLVHAKCPDKVNFKCDMKLSDNTKEIEDILWTRKEDYWSLKKNKLGNDKYFTIIGHTPVKDICGYRYDVEDNTLNIDGGCASYAYGSIEYDHVPLIMIDDENNRLIILVFNHNKKITQGYYFSNGESFAMNEKKLDMYREFLGSDVNVKKKILK